MGGSSIKLAQRFRQAGVYKSLSDATPGEIDLLDAPTPNWLDRDYPFVPPPGEDGSLKELQYLISLQSMRASNEEFIAGCDEDAMQYFKVLCEELGTPYPEDEVRRIIQDLSVLIAKLKWRYNRPRPYQVAAKAGAPFEPMSSKTAHSPAYPSGHSIQAHVVASFLSERSPQHRQEFMDLAHDVAWSRVVGGYHWPSDCIYAKDIFRHIVMPAMPAAIRVAAKFKNKREVPRADGKGTTTIYEYGPRQVAERHKQKAVRLQSLRSQLGKLRGQVKADLKSTDPSTRLTALAVALMDETYERVGNEKSAKDGHHGVTNWTAGHVSLSPKKAVIKYTGKSGVNQTKEVKGAALSALRKAVQGKGPTDKVLCDGNECHILAKDVNKYLKPFGITAKDIRGLHANEEMRSRLQEMRKGGEDLPYSRKEKDKILKAEFKRALEEAAAAVGHEASTLKSQYLVPGLESAYLKDGTILESFSKDATKSRAEKEDEEAQRLVRRSPKKKPPRKDLERGRLTSDEDIDPDAEQDMKDRSNNYKDAAYRVALRYLLAAGNVTKTDSGKYKAEKPSADRPQYFDDKGQAEKWLEQDEESGEEGEEGEEDKAEGLSEEELEEHKETKAQELKDQKKELIGDITNALGESPQKLLDLVNRLENMDTEDAAAYMKEKGESAKEWGGKVSDLSKAKAEAVDARKILLDAKASPAELGKASATVEHFEKVVDNPAVDTDNPLPAAGSSADKGQVKKDALARAEKGVAKYRNVDKKDRDRHSKKLKKEIDSLPKDDPKRTHLEGVQKSLEVSATLNGEKVEGVNPAMERLTKSADKAGNIKGVLAISGSDKEKQAATRDVVSAMGPSEMKEVLGKDHPAGEVVDFLSDSDLSKQDAAQIRQQLDDLAVAETMTLNRPSMKGAEGGLKEAISNGVGGIVGWVKGFIEGLFGSGGDSGVGSAAVESQKEMLKSPKKSDAEKRREFLQNADPETREKLKDLSPADFMKAMAAIMDEEELEVEV